jgi:hypothetical protein
VPNMLSIDHVLLCPFKKLSTSISGKVLLLHMHLPLPRLSKHHYSSSCHGLSHLPSDLSATSLPNTPFFPFSLFPPSHIQYVLYIEFIIYFARCEDNLTF